nr:hypothetical protein [uncultured Desulfuromonas sp.]
MSSLIKYLLIFFILILLSVMFNNIALYVILYFVPIIVLIQRIILLLFDGLWFCCSGKIVEFNVNKIGINPFSSLSESELENVFDNYISVTYEYSVGKKTFKSKRISLDLFKRGYRDLEIECDKNILAMKNCSECCLYHLKIFPSFSVLEKTTRHIYSNLFLLFSYLSFSLFIYLLVNTSVYSK